VVPLIIRRDKRGQIIDKKKKNHLATLVN